MKNKLIKLYNFSNSWTGTIIIVLFVIFFIAQAFVIPSGSMKRTLLVGDHLFVKKFTYGIPIPHLPWIEIPLLPDFNGNGMLFEGDRPKRGDIVVFRYPKNPKVHFVKRCVAISGDEVLYDDKNKHLYIHPADGVYPKETSKVVTMLGKKWIKDPYIQKYPGIGYDRNVNSQAQNYFQILDGKFEMSIVEVDSKTTMFYKKIEDESFFMMGDNRDHSNDSRYWGSVPYKLIEGTPWFIYWSWDDDYNIRWNRIGRNIEAMQYKKEFIDMNIERGGK